MRVLRPLLVASLLLAPEVAQAGGFYTSDIGARGMARAGAFVAAPDSVLAIHYNPSGLSLLKGFHLEIDGQLVDYTGKFERSCPCLPDGAPNQATEDARLEGIFDGNVARTRTPLVIPFLGIAYGFDFWDLTIGLAAWGPTSGRHNYGALPEADKPSFTTRAQDAVSRYSGLEMANLEANFGLGISMSPLEGLRIGATAFLFQSGNDQTLHLWANLTDTPENTNFDVPITLKFKENAALNWQVGAAYDIPYVPGRLTLGAAFRGKRDVRTGGTIDVELPTELAALASVEGNEVTVEVSTAAILRAGIQYQWDKLFRFEGAFVWEGWNQHDNIVIRPQNINFTALGNQIELGQIVADRLWEDTWSLRFGGEVNLFEPYLGLRAGYFYEPSAIPTSRLDPSRVDLDKHGISLGVSTTWYGVTLELSAMYIALATTTVTDSEVDITSPLEGDPNLLTFIGNGTYSGNYVIGAASLTFALDPLLSELSDSE